MYLCIGAVYLFIIIRITSFSYSELLTMYTKQLLGHSVKYLLLCSLRK